MNKKVKSSKSLGLIILSLISLFLLAIEFKDYLFNKLILMIFIVIVSLNIMGILFLVYFENDTKLLKLVSSIMLILFCINIVCFLFISIINVNIHSTYEDDIYYQEGYISYNKNINTYISINEIKNENLTVGVITNKDSEFYGKNSLIKLLNNYSIYYYDDDFSLFKALINNEIDIAVFSKYYKTAVKSNEDYSYVEYLDDVNDLYNFKDEVKHNKNELNKDTFNILLIGFAPENKEETLGSADGIMIATVNLKSLSINLTSIPRSTEVTYACAGNIRDRISETINYGESCLLSTVDNFVNLDIDHYIEFNFNAIVDIVDSIGGIVIDNPIEFVGQTSSSSRGDYSIYIPAGENIYVNGQEALAFIRERKVYSSDDDAQRQDNQQQVLSRIIEKLLNIKNPIEYIKVANALGKNVKTNISKKELLNILNALFNLKDNTGISLYSKLDFSNYRLYGTYVNSYSYYLRNPVSIFKIYQKSINDSLIKINDVLDQYTSNGISQSSLFSFFVEFPYYKSSQETDFSEEVLKDDNIPSYYPFLVGMSLKEAQQWASENDASLIVEYIKENDEGYDKNNAGNVIYQSVMYGGLIAENKECIIRVIED